MDEGLLQQKRKKEETVEEEDGSRGVVQENGGGVQGGQQRERDRDKIGQYERNVRQNVGLLAPPNWSRNNVDLTTANLVPKQGTISGVAPTTQINPWATLISLTELMEKGGHMRTVLVAMIMSITTADSTDTATARQEQGNHRQTKGYQRRLTFMCLKSS